MIEQLEGYPDNVVAVECSGHLTGWDRIAIVTDVDWIAHTMQFFGFLMPGDVRVFPVAAREAARDWIVAS